MKKTIAIFSCFALPHLGGIERYTDNLIKQLNKNEIKVILISTNYTFSFPLIEEKSDLFSHCYLPIFPIFTNRYPFIRHNSDLKKVIGFLDSQNIDAIIVNTRFHLTSLLGAKYGHKRKIPVFLIEHGSQHLTIDNKFFDFCGAIYEHALTFYIKKYVNQYYGVSAAACDWQRHFNIESNGIWYNSIDFFSDTISTQNACQGNHKKTILYAGRILKQKGVENLLESFINLKKKYSDIQLVVAGDGNLLPYLKEKYEDTSIIFTGQVDFDILQQLYATSDIFVYAPLWPEGLPTSILEAGLMKCAVISSPQGGITEIIEHEKNGLLVNSKDELQDALDFLLCNNDVRIHLGEELYSKVSTSFVWPVTCEKIIHDIVKYIN